MLKIVVAGAGHGGLTAAFRLAREGYDVTVVEAREREALGHDWHDSMRPDAFDFCGIPRPEDAFTPYVKARHNNPGWTVELSTDPAPVENVRYIDRKVLIRYLIAQAEAAGVKFRFGAEVTGPVINGGKVAGLFVRRAREFGVIAADLVIDAAGMHSPVRTNLPESCGIQRHIAPSDTYFVYRAYYEAAAGTRPAHPYNIVFFHTGLPGLDWLIDRDGTPDVLVGGIGADISDKIGPAVDDLRSRWSFIGEKTVRGGDGVYTIPLRRTLPLIVADGYAAVGDSAAMTEPMNGSGITLSMKAGRLLAETVIAAGENGNQTAQLWRYQVLYQKAFGEKYLTDEIVKGMLAMLTPADLDYLFEKGVLTAKEMLKDPSPVTLRYFLQKAALLGRPSLMKPLAVTGKRLAKLRGVCAMMPESWHPERVRRWIDAYEKL